MELSKKETEEKTAVELSTENKKEDRREDISSAEYNREKEEEARSKKSSSPGSQDKSENEMKNGDKMDTTKFEIVKDLGSKMIITFDKGNIQTFNKKIEPFVTNLKLSQPNSTSRRNSQNNPNQP